MAAKPVAVYSGHPDGPLGEPTGWRGHCPIHGWVGQAQPYTPAGERAAQGQLGLHYLSTHRRRGLASAVTRA